MNTIGEKLSPILEEIEDLLLEYEADGRGKPDFTEDGFRASIKIFMSALMDKMWEYQERQHIPQIEREMLAEQCGRLLSKLIHRYTGIDTTKLYE